VSLRRIIALVVLVGALLAIQRLRSSDLGLDTLVWLLGAAVLALMAFAVAVFNLPIGRGAPFRESGFENSVLGERRGLGLGCVMAYLFGLVLVAVAIKSVRSGSVSTPWASADVRFAQAPFEFLLGLALWLGGAGGVFWVSRQIWLGRSEPRPEHKRPRRTGR